MSWTWQRLHSVTTSLALPPGEYVAGIGARLLVNGAITQVDYAELLVTPGVYESLIQQGWQRVTGENAIEHPSQTHLVARTGDVSDTYVSDVPTLLATATQHDGLPVVPVEAAVANVTRALIMGGIAAAMQEEAQAAEPTEPAEPRRPYEAPAAEPGDGEMTLQEFQQLDQEEFGRRLQMASNATWGEAGPPPVRIRGLSVGLVIWIPVVLVSLVVGAFMVLQSGGFAHLLGHTEEVPTVVISSEDTGSCEHGNEFTYQLEWTRDGRTHEGEYEDCISRRREPEPAGSTIDLWVDGDEVVADYSPLLTRVMSGAVFLAPILVIFFSTGSRKKWLKKWRARRKERKERKE